MERSTPRLSVGVGLGSSAISDKGASDVMTIHCSTAVRGLFPSGGAYEGEDNVGRTNLARNVYLGQSGNHRMQRIQSIDGQRGA